MSETLACPACALLCRAPEGAADGNLACPRCHAQLWHRKPATAQRTWAFLVAAAILYVPANMLPAMRVTLFGHSQPNTILSGVVELFQSGMWEIGALVFVVSITVPLLKILTLAYLLLSLRRGTRFRREELTRMYRVVEYIGRWSMLDMFMLSILVALVQLGWMATIHPGPGATCFAGVVILTMFAASSFDPRLIWDDQRGVE